MKRPRYYPASASSSSVTTTTCSTSCCLRKEDCESSVTMKFRCTRSHMLALILPVAMLFSALNAYLSLYKHVGDDGNRADFFKTANNRKRRSKKKRWGPVKPRSSSLAPNATFSACLLIKDDNEILSEWIAYHYHVIRMRHLIVAVDPSSSETPSEILQQWQNSTDLVVTEWNDENYLPEVFFENDGRPPPKHMEPRSKFGSDVSHTTYMEISTHRYRQRVFLAQCLRHVRDEVPNGSWVMHIDTDEYITASKLLRQMKPEYLAPLPAPMDQSGSVLRLLQAVVHKTPELVAYPCISMLRVLYGSVESTPNQRQYQVPPGYNGTKLETMRWRHHALPHNRSLHGNPKVLLDVSALPEAVFPKEIVFSIHRPITEFCHRTTDLSFASFRKQPIGVNHYLGSWERYNARNDKRRSRAVYEAKASVSRGRDDGIRPWLAGFIEAVGTNLSATLLQRYHSIDSNASTTIVKETALIDVVDT